MPRPKPFPWDETKIYRIVIENFKFTGNDVSVRQVT